MTSFQMPVPLNDLETVLSWVDGFKLSRSTKKINRDFSDAVLLAEILLTYYPKLVEMHNYPPRNSTALKLNNWMTLNRKVLKKIKLNLCLTTMEQLANSVPGVIERVLLSVYEKIRRDEELNKSLRDEEQTVSSGGSYYEACGEDDHVLVVPVKARVNGVLEISQQKVVPYNVYLAMKEELKDSKESIQVLKNKVEHLEEVLKIKETRIDELQKQVERKASRRKEIDIPVVVDTTPSNYEFLNATKSVEDIPLNTKDSNEDIKSVTTTNTLEIMKNSSTLIKTSKPTSIIDLNKISNPDLNKQAIDEMFRKSKEAIHEKVKSNTLINPFFENNEGQVFSCVNSEMDEIFSEGFHDTEELKEVDDINFDLKKSQCKLQTVNVAQDIAIN